jgi:hypothetical protein
MDNVDLLLSINSTLFQFSNRDAFFKTTNTKMDAFLKTRKPVVIARVSSKERYGDRSAFQSFLTSRRPSVIKEAYGVDDSDISTNPYVTMIAPMNTDLRWRKRRVESYTDDSDARDPANELVIPPLNTDVRFSEMLPTHTPTMESNPQFMLAHPHKPHAHETSAVNFSWHIVTSDDDQETVRKKSLIQPVQNQHMCGSCWAMAMAAVISDCLVVGGVVQWMPYIAPTFIMMIVPPNEGNGQCDGGNPATVALALESLPVADTSCVDYSWCTNDAELCTSASAASHFQSSFSQKLNANIPKAMGQNGGCYFTGQKYLYKIDKGSDAFFINKDAPAPVFREMIKAHIVDFGPPLGGYAVLRNFVTGNFTDPSINQGVYFDRCDYNSEIVAGRALQFDDRFANEAQLSGLHAVSIIGWGLASNIQYDNDLYGDVPFWWCRNSWGSNWGNMNGYFKIAMYPFNRFAQFDSQIMVRNFPIGGMILVRATGQPEIGTMPQIEKRYFDRIKRIKPDSYYHMTPEELGTTRPSAPQTEGSRLTLIIIGVIVVVAIALFIVLANKR